VGVGPDGTLAATAEGQHEQAWRSILAILASAGLGPRDLVDVTAYVTDAADVRLYREVRDRMLGGAAPASTILIVAGLADPRWRVEISAVAAKA
jgi:enamine deaminase RidA (YjgF/YER057c/UK114 family)